MKKNYTDFNNPVNSYDSEDFNIYFTSSIKLKGAETPLAFSVVPYQADLPVGYVFWDIHSVNMLQISQSSYEAEYLAFNNIVPKIYTIVTTDKEYTEKFFDYNSSFQDGNMIINIDPSENLNVRLYRYKVDGFDGWAINSNKIYTNEKPKTAVKNANIDELLKQLASIKANLNTNDVNFQKLSKSIKDKSNINVNTLFKMKNTNVVDDSNKTTQQLSFDFGGEFEENNNNMINPLCKYATFKLTEEVKFISKDYKYDNIPHSYVSCSCPSLNSMSDQKILPCRVGLTDQLACSYYEPESKLLATYTGKDESSRDHSYSVSIQTTNTLNKRADIVNNINGQITYVMGVPNTANDEEVMIECDEVLEAHFSNFGLVLQNCEVHKPLNTNQENSKKKSFILSLI